MIGSPLNRLHWSADRRNCLNLDCHGLTDDTDSKRTVIDYTLSPRLTLDCHNSHRLVWVLFIKNEWYPFTIVA